jgi:predicted  nucleic acid-binding Zn-ribbon protein
VLPSPSTTSSSRSAASQLEGHEGAMAATATVAQSLAEITVTLGRQTQALDSESARRTESVQRLVEVARRAQLLAERHRSQDAGKEQQLLAELDEARAMQRAQQQELGRVTADARLARAQLEDARALAEQAQARLFAAAPGMGGTQGQHVACQQEADRLRARARELEAALEAAAATAAAAARRADAELKEERDQLAQALERLAAADEKAVDLRRKLRSALLDVERLEGERDRLSVFVEDASSQLRGVATHKTAVSRELEEVYSSLTDLERQLLQSRAENHRLRQRLGTLSSSETADARPAVPDSSARNATAEQRRPSAGSRKDNARR